MDTGTGGVSLQALLIALAGGITPIITSSSDEKLDNLRKKLGRPDLLGFNYRTHPDQAAEVKRLTGGRGVDIVVNNAGPVSFLADIDSLVQSGGTISIVGYLGGFQADWNPGELFKLVAKHAKLQ
jgi:NADPH:quinone reductase-like Zn-dependent oxidoreductase